MAWPRGEGGWGLQTPHRASSDVILKPFSDSYFEVLDILSLIIWFCNCHNNKNYVALFPESCSLMFNEAMIMFNEAMTQFY